VVERKNIFSMASDFGRRDPFAPFRIEEPTTVDNLERRLSMAERAAEQARIDLDVVKSSRGVAASVDDKDEKISRWTRQGALDERARILAILRNPVSLRQPRLAEKFAFKSDVPSRDAIAAMEEHDRDAAKINAKSLSDQIVHMGKVRRGEVDAPVTGTGPKTFVKATAEDILASGRKARAES
jgi:hypothetical protein